MFILANFIRAIAGVLDFLISIFYWLILIRVLVSWVNPDPFNPIVQFLKSTTEPILAPIRSRLPFRWQMTFDVSPIVAFLLLLFIKSFLVNTLMDLSTRLR